MDSAYGWAMGSRARLAPFSVTRSPYFGVAAIVADMVAAIVGLMLIVPLMVAAAVPLIAGHPASGLGSDPAHGYVHRYGSGLTQVSVAHISSISPSARILPMRTVLYVCWLSPSILTLPSGASNSIPLAAALTAATSVDPAFSTA